MNRLLSTMIGLLLIFSAAAASAQPSQAEIDAFRLYKQAQASMKLAEYDQAIEQLNQAWSNFRMPQIALLKAKVLKAMGNLESALMVLKGIDSDSQKIIGKVETAIAEIEGMLAQPIEIDVSSSVDQIRMVIDKTTTFFVPGSIKVMPGRHRVEYSAPGYRTKVVEHDFSPYESSMTVVMDEVGGRVILTTNLDSFFGMVVKIDDRELMPSGTSITPNRTSPIEIPAGTHTYTCMKNGLPDYSGTFTLVSTQVLEVECPMAPAGTRPGKANKYGGYSAATWALFGVGTALAVGGTALTGQYWYSATSNKGSSIQYAGYWAPAVAGVGIAMAIMGFFVFDKVEPEKSDSGLNTTYSFSVGPMQDGAAAAMQVNF